MHHHPVKQRCLRRRAAGEAGSNTGRGRYRIVPEMDDCLGGSPVQNRHSASGPGCVKSRPLADSAESSSQTSSSAAAARFLYVRKCNLKKLYSPHFVPARLFTQPGPTPDIGAFGGGYAASFGIALSTNRKNRVLRPPATNDTGDSEFPGSPVPFRRDRVLRVPATTFIITRLPSRSNHRDGFGFLKNAAAGRRSRFGWGRSVAGSIENDRRVFALDKASSDATRALVANLKKSGVEEKIAAQYLCEKSGLDVRIVPGAPFRIKLRTHM
jgi:hypothetical protein